MSPAHAPADERALIERAQRGEQEPFGELVARYQDRVYNLAYRLCGHPEDASEMAQDVFLKAFKAMRSFKSRSSFYSWLYRITVNTATSRWRYRAVRPVEVSLTRRGDDESAEAMDGMPDDTANPAQEASRREERRLVEQAIARLAKEQRMIIVLRDIEGRNYADIADTLGWPKGTVKSRLHRARLALRDLLTPMLDLAGES